MSIAETLYNMYSAKKSAELIESLSPGRRLARILSHHKEHADVGLLIQLARAKNCD